MTDKDILKWILRLEIYHIMVQINIARVKVTQPPHCCDGLALEWCDSIANALELCPLLH